MWVIEDPAVIYVGECFVMATFEGYVNHFSCEQEILATLSVLKLAETIYSIHRS